MNLPSIIDSLRRSLPGWTPPPQVDTASDGKSVLYHGETYMPTEHAAAIIVASVKEWLAINDYEVTVQIVPDPNNKTRHYARIRRSAWHSAPTELEALAKACEAIKGALND